MGVSQAKSHIFHSSALGVIGGEKKPWLRGPPSVLDPMIGKSRKRQCQAPTLGQKFSGRHRRKCTDSRQQIAVASIIVKFSFRLFKGVSYRGSMIASSKFA
jgi:hypothetical protein